MAHRPKIYLVGDNQEDVITLEETAYKEELVLQKFLVNYPDLLPGDQIDPEDPRRWLLVKDEMPVPVDEASASKFSLDHLFLDQDGIPTFVECKRAENREIRREIVGQMLDYAANGIEYWGVARIRQAAATTALAAGRSLDAAVAELISGSESEEEIEEYWQRVEDNLRDRRVRLLFVADRIPKELRRLVEFLNEEMPRVEVLAVEVKQYRAEEGITKTVLVPRIIGATETARAARASSQRRPPMTRDDFFSRCSAENRPFFEKVLAAAGDRGDVVNWGPTRFSVRALLPEGKKATYAYCLPTGEFEVYFGPGLFVWEQEQAVRADLLALGLFKKVSEMTLRMKLDRENLSQAEAAHSLLLQRLDEFSETS